MRWYEIKQVLLSEALKLSQYRNLVKGWNKERYKEIFLNPKYKHDRNGFRVFIPFETQRTNIPISRIQTMIEKYLNDNNYDLIDYARGIASNRKHNQKIKIGKLLTKLKNTELLNLYNTDTSRQAVNTDNYITVISRHPYDIAGMSTDRGWTSCMNLKSGISSENCVPLDIKQGTVIAYVVRPDDLDLKNPIGRVLIKPFIDILGKTQVYFGIEERVYGTNVPGFLNTVKDWVDQVNQNHELDEVAVLKFNPNLYIDSDLSYKVFITGKNLSTKEKKEIAKLHEKPELILNDPDPSENKQIAAISSSNGDNIFRELMKRENYIPSEKIQLIAVTKAGSLINLIIEKEITPSDAVIEKAVNMNPASVIPSLISKNIRISEKAMQIGVSKSASVLVQLIENYKIDKIPKSVYLVAVSSHPRSISYLFDKNLVDLDIIKTAFEHGLTMVSAMNNTLNWFKYNNKIIDKSLIDLMIKNNPVNFLTILDFIDRNKNTSEKIKLSFNRDQIIDFVSENMFSKNNIHFFTELFSHESINFTEDMLFEIVKKTKSSKILFQTKSLKNQEISEDLAEKCIDIDGESIRFIKNQTPDLQKRAVTSSPNALKYISLPTDEACIISLEKDPRTLVLIDEPTSEMLNAVANYKIKNVENDIFPFYDFLQKLEESDLTIDEQVKLINISLNKNTNRIKEYVNFPYFNEIIIDHPKIIHSLIGKVENLFAFLIDNDIFPPIELIEYTLKNQEYGILRITNKIKRFISDNPDYKNKFNIELVERLIKSIPEKEDRSKFIIYMMIHNITQPNDDLIKIAIDEFQDKWVITNIIKYYDNVEPKHINYFLKKFEYSDYNIFHNLYDIFDQIEKTDKFNKEEINNILYHLFENKTDQISRKILIMLNVFVEKHANDEFLKYLIKQDKYLYISMIEMFRSDRLKQLNDYGYQEHKVWEPISVGDMVRITNPNATPRYKIKRILHNEYYVIESPLGEKIKLSVKRIHKANGLIPPHDYIYSTKRRDNENK